MSKFKSIFKWRIDDVDSGAIKRNQEDSPVIVDTDQATIHKIVIRDKELKLDSYDKDTLVATQILTAIDLAYVSTKLYMNKNFI